MQLKLLTPCLVLVTACNSTDSKVSADVSAEAVSQPEAAVWTQQTAWRLSAEPAVEIKGSEEQVEQAALDPVRAFRLSDGRYAVGDGDQSGWDALIVFDHRGKHAGSFGGEGEGPGEFRQLLNWAGTYRGDSIAAYDFVDRAVEIFSSDGRFGRALKLPQTRPSARPPRGTYGASDYFIGAFADGSVLRFEPTVLDISTGTGPVYFKPDLTLFDADGLNPRVLGQFPTWGSWWTGQEAIQYMFQPMAVTATGKVNWYHGVSDSFKVRVMDRNGREVRVLRRSIAPEAVTADDREAVIQQSLAMMRASREGSAATIDRVEKQLREKTRFADVKPVFSHIIEDEAGNVWVEHFRWLDKDILAPNPKPSRWSVFDPQGTFLGEIQVPASFLVSSITNDQVIGFFKDELDVEHVRVYGLIKP
jgi:hypothetical protein